MSRLLSAKGGCRGRQYAGYARQLHGAAARGSYARRLHVAATPGGYTATINRYAAADACARTTPTEACVKQHLGAVAETGEEGARLLPPQLFQACRYFRPVAISAHGYFRPAAMSARARRSATRAGRRRRTLCCALCPLMLYPFRLTAPPTVLRIAQAAEDFVPEKLL